MFGFIKQMFFRLLRVCTMKGFGESLVSNSKGPIKYVSLDNQSYQARPKLVHINSNQTFFYPFAANVNKCGRNCNNIDDPYGPVCVTNKVKNINLKVFNLLSGVDETRFFVQHGSWKCKCGLNEIVCKSNQKWNHYEYRCE